MKKIKKELPVLIVVIRSLNSFYLRIYRNSRSAARVVEPLIYSDTRDAVMKRAKQWKELFKNAKIVVED